MKGRRHRPSEGTHGSSLDRRNSAEIVYKSALDEHPIKSVSMDKISANPSRTRAKRETKTHLLRQQARNSLFHLEMHMSRGESRVLTRSLRLSKLGKVRQGRRREDGPLPGRSKVRRVRPLGPSGSLSSWKEMGERGLLKEERGEVPGVSMDVVWPVERLRRRRGGGGGGGDRSRWPSLHRLKSKALGSD